MLQLMIQHDSINTVPGEVWNYNNGGYALLTVVVERITGQRFEEVLTERILKPVGMHDTVLRRRDRDILANSASLHLPQPDGTWVRGEFGMPIAGEGAMASTIGDMLLWLAHLRNPTRVGSAATWAEMKTSGVLNDGGETGYGYGLMIGEYRGQKVIHHAGGVIGGNSQMITLPDLALDIAIMANRADLNAFVMAEKIIDTCVIGLTPKGEKPETAVTGAWFSASTGTLVKLSEHEGAQMVDVMGAKLPVVVTPTGALRGDPDVLGMSVKLLDPEAGAASELELNATGAVQTLQPLEAAPDGMVTPLGLFTSKGAGARAVLAEQDGKIILSTSNPMGAYDYALEPVGAGVWLCTPADGAGPMVGLLEAEPRADAQSFTFSSGRTRRLRFERA